MQRQNTKALLTMLLKSSWIETLFELSIPRLVSQVFCNNQSAVAFAHNPVLHACTKYMKLDVFLVHDRALCKQLQVQHVPGLDRWADLFTKLLSPTRFLHLRSKLNVVAPSEVQPP